MTKQRAKTRRRRSRSVPLSLVPALAAIVGVGCSKPKPADPCEPASFTQVACESAVANRGYWHSGTWYPHVYPFAAMYYLSRHNSFVAGGGRVRSVSPTVYSPRPNATARPGVVRSGFGGIGAGHGAAGS
jgi:hypothetical protein